MTSEIRVNKINNRAGLGTITIADTGVIVNGIVTCTEISGLNALNIAGVSTFASPLDINGDIDVDGHTNLDNLSVAGVSTFSNVVNVGNNIQFTPSSGNISGTTATFDDFVDVGSNIKLGNAGVVTATTFSTANVDVTTDKIVVGTGVTIEANQVATGQATFTGIVTASAFKLSDGTAVGGLQQTNTLNFGGAVSIINTGAHDLNLSITDQGSIKFRTETDSGGGDGWDIDPFGNFIPHVNDGNNICLLNTSPSPRD